MILKKVMKKISLILFAFVFFSFGEKVENILFISVDDLKPSIGCFEDEIAITPFMDELAESGTVFLNAHCQQAICGPSRASVMTGMRPDNTQVLDLKTKMRDKNPDILTIPQYFRNLGYETIGMGKIFDPRCVDNKNDQPSWSQPYTRFHELPAIKGLKGTVIGHFQSDKAHELLEEAKNKGLTKYADQKKYLHERGGNQVVEAADVPDAAYEDGTLNEYAKETLKKLKNSNKPFFLAVGYKRPHLPFTAPKKYWDMYKRDDFKIHPYQKKARNAAEIAYTKVGELKSYNGVPDYESHSKDASKHIPEVLQLELIHGYYACVSYIDQLIGDLVNELKKLNLDKNTAIVIWGDHGWHLGDHGLWCKHTNFEQATRSPLIFISPNIKGGNKTFSPVEFIDIFPTLCDLTEQKIPNQLDGMSLKPLMLNPSHMIKSSALSQWPSGNRMGYAIRNKRYRYVEWVTGDTRQSYDEITVISRQLFDYKKDPLETINLADESQYKEIANYLQNELKTYFKN